MTSRGGLEHSKTPVEVVAPRWHTAALITLILAVAVTGTLLVREGGPVPVSTEGSRILGAYLPLLLVNVGLTFYVSRVGRSRSALRALLGRGWDSFGRACADLALAAAAWGLIEGTEAVWAMWRPAAPAAILPHSALERVIWVLVAATVGACEEVVYRGYLQAQLTAFTRRVPVAIALQAVLFGVAHGDQGVAVVLRFAVYGVLLGALARWRQSLWPGIACHVAIDVVSGLLSR